MSTPVYINSDLNGSLKGRAVKGVMWTGSAKLLTQALLFLVMIILGRLLTPEDFGVVGMAALITVAITLVNDRGIGTAIVQRKEIYERHLSSVFWASVILGLILFLCSTVCSKLFILFFKNKQIGSVVVWLASGFIIGSFGIVHKAILFRKLDFKTLAVIEIIGVFAYGILSITMAILGFGVWSLVWSALLKDTVINVILWITGDWKPKLLFSWHSFRELFGFSANVLGTDVMLYVNSNIDFVLVGRILGETPLGYYTYALNMVKMPVQRLSGVVSKVAFPTFSAVQDDLPKFQAGFLKSTLFISVVTFPLMIGLMIMAPEIVKVLLGEKWLPMVIPLQILCPMGLLKSVGTTRGAVLTACGRADIEFRWNFIYLLPLVIAVYLGTRFGITGVAIGFTSLYVITFPIIQMITNSQIKLKMVRYIDSLVPAGLAGMIMTLVLLVLKYVVHRYFHMPQLLLLISGILVGGVSYIMALLLYKKVVVLELMSLIFNSRKKRIQL